MSGAIPSLAGGKSGGRSIQVKLLLLMGTVLALVLAVTVLAFNQLLNSSGVTNLTAKAQVASVIAAESMAEGVEFRDVDVLQPMLDGIMADKDVIGASVHDASGASLVSRGESGTIALLEAPQVERRTVTIEQAVKNGTGTRSGTVRLVYTREGVQAGIQRATIRYAGISFVFLVLGLVVVGVSLGRMVRPIRVLTEATTRIVSAGDLTQRVPVSSNDEIGQLASAFNLMLDKLRQVPLSLQGSVNDLGAAVEGLTLITRAQTASVQRQASGVSEASATTQEIKQTSAVAAAKAETVLQVATKAEAFSGAGQSSVEASIQGLTDIRAQIEAIVGRIGELSERTLQVGEIIESVKDLADQSNVLALNAAIEAAKAGEFGKGFGVVAREIRSLADQSIQSTGRIREILSEIQGAIRSTVTMTEGGKVQMERSMEQIRASGENLREMTAIVHESSQAARQIAASVGQQNVGITQISSAINSLDAGMEETLAAIRGAESAVDNLKGISGRISGIVQGFRV